MRKSLLISILLISFFSLKTYSQVPTIRAIGGSIVDWGEVKRNWGPGPEFHYSDCAHGVEPVRASSTLPQQGIYTYGIENISDYNPMSAWVEGEEGYGIGEWFEVRAIRVNSIYNGFQHSPEIWKDNSRVKKFKVYRNDTLLCFLELNDQMNSQRFTLPEVLGDVYFDPDIFRFEIVEVYKGDKWSDVAISDIEQKTCCFSANTKIIGHSKEIMVSDISDGNSILTIDINTGEISNTGVLKTTKQTHLRLLKISTLNYQIEITPDHPLFINGYGFTSLLEIKSIKGVENYTELINEIEFLIWNNETEELHFEKLTSVESKEGVFDTYTILELEEGSTYIANGFINEVY